MYVVNLLTFENEVPLMRYGATVVWHHSLLSMNSFNKTEAAVFSCRLCFLRDSKQLQDAAIGRLL